MRPLVWVLLAVACTTAAPVGAPVAGDAPTQTPTAGPSTTAAPTEVGPMPLPPPAATDTAAVGDATPPPLPPAAWPTTIDPALALDVATALATEVGPRPAASPADARAQALVAERLRALGWHVTTQRVALPSGAATQNLLAHSVPRPPAGRHLVVGAHLDTVAGSPGANDNASGVGVLVAVASALAGRDLPVVLVVFGGEEFQPGTRAHHLGSEAYAAAWGDRVEAMVSLDMVGVGPRTCLCWLSDPTLAEELAALLADPAFEVRAAPDQSDHGPFDRRGIPAVHLWTGRDGRYHTSADTAEHLQPDALARAGHAVLVWLAHRLGP